MKKKFSKPTIRIVEAETSNMICSSGDSSDPSMKFGGPDKYTPTMYSKHDHGTFSFD